MAPRAGVLPRAEWTPPQRSPLRTLQPTSRPTRDREAEAGAGAEAGAEAEGGAEILTETEVETEEEVEETEEEREEAEAAEVDVGEGEVQGQRVGEVGVEKVVWTSIPYDPPTAADVAYETAAAADLEAEEAAAEVAVEVAVVEEERAAGVGADLLT